MAVAWGIRSCCLAALCAGAALTSAPAAAIAPHPEDRSDPPAAEENEANSELYVPIGEAEAAAPAETAGSAEGPVIVAGAIRVEGATELKAADFAAAIEPWLGRPLGPDELRALAGDVASAARAAGFGLATAFVPQQNVTDGILRVVVDEGRVDSVEVQGGARGLVEPRLAGLADGRPLRTVDLERRLLLAADLPGVTIGRPEIVRRDGRNILIVSTGYDRVRGRASIDNSGTQELGPVRARLAVDLNGLVADGDRLSVGGAVTPLQPREFQFAQLTYSMPVGSSGTELSLSGHVGRSRAGASVRDRDLDGVTREVKASVTHPILRSRDANLWAGLSATVRDSSLDREGAAVRDDRIVVTTASLYGIGRVPGGRARVRLSYNLGLDLLDSRLAGDPLASRRDGSGKFSTFAFWAQYDARLGGGFSLQLAGEGQLASRPLLASEEMGLGGRRFLRGFDYWEMSGDQGVAGSAELRYDMTRGLPSALKRLQLYAYGDAGRATNLRGGSGGGTLASAGGGLRAWLRGQVEAEIELGVPLTDGLFEDDPDPRFSFSLGSRF